MDTRAKFEATIVKKCGIENIKGYVRDYRHNVFSSISSDEYEADLMGGAGSELKSKFAAIYSSSALVVNTFAPFKRFKDSISLLGFNNFTRANFERPFDTGLSGTWPTLDFCLESESAVIAIESKYLEVLREKEAKFVGSYLNNKEIIGDHFLNIINKYNKTKGYLDTAQLIKHTIGLEKYAIKTNKKCILLYLYWMPLNYKEYEIYEKHKKEIDEFKNDISGINKIEFFEMNYIDFWNKYRSDNVIGGYIKETEERYKMKID